MKQHWLDEIFIYDGLQLRSQFAEEKSGMSGDIILAWCGGANVPIEHMVDLEDVAKNAPIFSELMLHFIIEMSGDDLEKMVLRQRLFIAILAETLQRDFGVQNLVRSGNDMYDGKCKLSVSVATQSPHSCLIHTGINISSKNTPVLTKGLEDYNKIEGVAPWALPMEGATQAPIIDPKKLAHILMQRFVEELDGVIHATGKVRNVG